MVQMKNVRKVYESSKTVALDDVSLTVNDGEFVFLVGPSGSGKTTIMKLITGEVRPTSGSVIVNDFDMTTIKRRKLPKMRRTLGVVFQDYRLIENMNVYDNVAFAMRVIGASEKEIKKRVPYVLTLVGLQDKANNMPNEISGGEQQRVALARALVNNANTIIADEPTGNVDPEMSYEIVELLDRINENGTTIIMVTHEHELVKQFDHRIVVIDNGEVVSDMANGGVLHYDSKTGYQPVPNVTEMKTITLHNVSFQNAPVTQVIEPQAPAAVEEPVEIEVPVETAPAAEEPTLSFAEATLKEIELDIEAKRGGDSNG